MQTDEEGDYSAAEEESINAISTTPPVDIKAENPNTKKNKSLFLNFTSDLYLQESQGGKKKKPTTNSNNIKPQASFKVNGVNILNRYPHLRFLHSVMSLAHIHFLLFIIEKILTVKLLSTEFKNDERITIM